MNAQRNPFEYEGANNLPDEEIIDNYIEDFNYSRFIQSTKNIFLVGERGSGKTMTLLYNSFKIKYKEALKKNTAISFDRIGIHVPCNTPLFHKKEYLLLNDEFKKSIICEHYLVLSILYAITDSLSDVTEIISDISESMKSSLIEELEYLWGIELDRNNPNFFVSIKKYINKEMIETQKKINSYGLEAFYENALTFSSSIIPFLNSIRSIDKLKKTHFLIMIDDAHDMNRYQIQTLNSWIAYRDHSMFSFKIATAKVNRPPLITSSGGAILEGHDFISVDMEKPFQNEEADFFKLAKKIIERRLDNIGLKGISAESFFPINKEFEKSMKECRDEAKIRAQQKYPDGPTSKISEFVYKYHRAIYFKERSPKANKPPYSGFESIVDVSTGIVRNLLDPCFWMYDKVLNTNKGNITQIPSNIQNEVICERSERLWGVLRDGLDRVFNGCTPELSKNVLQLLENLMVLFKKRLMSSISEPRAIIFSISQKDSHIKEYEELVEIINIARKAQYIYTRYGNSKEKGKQQIYYVPNRMLFPTLGLDPHGQYSRVMISAFDLWNAAKNNKALPFNIGEESNTNYIQKSLFDE